MCVFVFKVGFKGKPERIATILAPYFDTSARVGNSYRMLVLSTCALWRDWCRRKTAEHDARGRLG